MKAIIIVFLLVGHILQYSQSVAEQSVRIVLPFQKHLDCPARQRCFTLPECLRNTSSCFNSSTTITFLPGEHYTDGVSQFVTVQGVANLTIIGSVQGNVSTIYCNEKVGIAFVQCQDLTIYGISFHQCGRSIPTNLLDEALQEQTQTYYYFFEGTKAALFLVNVMNLNATKVQISHSDGYGLFALNVLGYSTIKDSVFSYNNQHALLYHQRNPMYCEAPAIQNTTSCTGGNAVFLYQDTPHCSHNNSLPWYDLSVVDSIFTHGVNLDYQHSDTGWEAPPYYLYTAGGLSIFTGQRSYKIIILVHNATIDSNIGHNGANLVVYIHNLGDTSIVNIIRSTITNGNCDLEFFANTAYSGGIYLYYGASAYWKDACEDLWAPPCTKAYNLNYFLVSNCTFANNSGFLGAAMCFISIIDALPPRCVRAKALVEQCYVHNNTGVSTIVYAEEDFIGDSHDESLFLELQNSAIHQNQFTKDTKQWGYNEPLNGTVAVRGLTYLKIVDCNITENAATGLYIDIKSPILTNNIKINGNTGLHGGGLALSYRAILQFTCECFQHVHIENNRAIYGSGIFVENPPTKGKRQRSCFFDLKPECYSDLKHNAYVVLKNNTAIAAGDSLYGGSIDKCYVYVDASVCDSIDECSTRYMSGINFFQPGPYQLFYLPTNLSTSEISSDPRQICFCDNHKPQCGQMVKSADPFPGAMFNVSAVAVGQLNGTVPAVALSAIAEGYSAGLALESQQEAQQMGRECSELQYRISTNKTAIQIDIRVNYERKPGPQDVVIKKISIIFKDCPLGFKLLPKIGRCDCIDFLSEKGIACNIDHQSFQRPVPVWIGYRDEKILVHDTCPLDYCKTYTTEVTVNTTDQLCTFSRSGILCGGCKQGLSLVFATSQCHKCSNSYLALLLVFIALGFVLVLVMIYGDLTISKGTLNGLIFYANIVQVNRNVIFPAGHSNILTVFIAWLNLDFGIETCFYNGMDDYGRTWLQFLFPIYIWVLVIIIIIASWYSSLAAKITGSNVLAVLATLFLLSYTKLQRTVLTAFSFTLVTTHDDSTFPVWLYDGNVPFFGPKHAVLFVMAVVATVCFILPYTLLVLFGPLLQAKFSRYMLRLWLTPILDAYQGPYKDRFRCWTGVMLVVRSFLLLVFAMNALGSAQLNLMLIVSITIVLLTFTWNAGTIYQKFMVNVIESFYILNLGLLSAWTEFNRQDMDSAKFVQKQAAISYTLVGTAFVGFLAIVCYHLTLQVRRFKNSRYWCWAKREAVVQLQPMDDRAASPSPIHIPVPPTVSYIDVYEQESLLSDTLGSEQ